MLGVHRPLGSELTLRLVHDISPEFCDSSEEDDDEATTAVQREQFILSCLAQSAINNNNSITHLSQTTCDQYCDKSQTSTLTSTTGTTAATISETYAKQLEWKQSHLEQINNHINEQHLTKVLEDNNLQINLINNNFLQSPYDNDSSDKENVNPTLVSSSSPRPGSGGRGARRPRRLPDIPKKAPGNEPVFHVPPSVNNEKCLADELQEALVKADGNSDSDHDDVFLPAANAATTTVATATAAAVGASNGGAAKPGQKVYPKYSGHLLQELKNVKFQNSVSKNTRAYLNSDNIYLQEDSTERAEGEGELSVAASRGRRDDGEGPRRESSSQPATNYQDLVVTHRGMHRFATRHKDEIAIEIGDPIHVIATGDDLWCEGVNLRTNQRGIFPSMYATDLSFLEEEEETNGCSKFFLRFLGSVEVNYHKGDDVLCQAINKVALSRRAANSSVPPPVCNLEISQYGIRMFDKSKAGHEQLDTDTFTHFFALKNITFCGHHPRNERYFGFMTKHPNQYRYACHVFLGEKSTRSVTDAMGQAFKRFYQEYMAFTHPTEDIYME